LQRPSNSCIRISRYNIYLHSPAGLPQEKKR